MFWEVSNYSLWPMEKINFCILLFLLFLTSFCTSYDYKYDEYDYEDHYDYADDYSQESNYYYDQNLIAPPNPPQLPPIPFPTPPPPPPPMGKITFFLFWIWWNMDYSH